MKASEVYGNLRCGGMEGNFNKLWEEWIAAGESDFRPHNHRVLEVGAGKGETCENLKMRGNHVIGSDVSEKTIEEIRSHADEAFLFDIAEEKAPYDDGSFDDIICLDVLEHVSNIYFSINELKRLCKIGGRIHFSIPDYDQQVGYSSHRHSFIYPGLFRPEFFEIFLKQMYLKILFKKSYEHPFVQVWFEGGRKEAARHFYYVTESLETKKDILQVIAGDYSEEELYPFMFEKS